MRAASALGRQSWYMGYRPSYLFLRALYRARENVASLATVWGYALAAISRAPRRCHAEVIERIREGQRLRVVIPRGRWTWGPSAPPGPGSRRARQRSALRKLGVGADVIPA
jgi:hypothetical protein